jgi:hypothetical protein
MILLVALAPNWWVLAVCLFVGGSLDAIADGAQNANGLRVQRLYSRSILNSFHAIWSVGAVLGALMGSAAAGLGLPLVVHLGGSGVLFSAVVLGTYRVLLSGPEAAEVDHLVGLCHRPTGTGGQLCRNRHNERKPLGTEKPP